MQKINIGIIGGGRIADLHYLGYEQNPNARIYAICDTNKEILEKRKNDWRVVKTYHNYQDLLNDKEIDAVEILTPHNQNLHEEIVIAAANSGKHIAVQKPMTTSLASADRMLEAVKKKNIVYKVTENYVFYPPIVKAKELIESGEIGEVTNLRIKFISGSSGGWAVPSSSWEWRMDEILAGRGTATFDHGHHLWSTAYFLLGEVEKVAGWIDFSQDVLDCPAVIIWKYKDSNKYGSCDFAHSTNLYIPSKYYANDEWIEITGSQAILRIHRCSGNIETSPVLSIFKGKSTEFIDMDSDWSLGFKGAAQNFVDSIKGTSIPLLSGKQGREVLRFSLAVQKAARLNREVYLEELDSLWPSFYAWQRRKANKPKLKKKNWSIPFFGRENLSDYAPQAKSLTEGLVRSFDPKLAANWDLTIGIYLTADGQVGDEKICLSIKNGTMDLKFGEIPENTTFTVTMPAGVWAAILLRKKRAEIAFLQGKIKAEGQVEEGLKLRAIFKL
jgi:predicted dehydrogenase/putative sterol carrier protein